MVPPYNPLRQGHIGGRNTLSSSLLIFQFKTESSVDVDFSIFPSSASAFLGRFFTKISVFFSPCVPSWRHSRAYDRPSTELNEQTSHCSSPLLVQMKKKQKKRNKYISCVSILASPADRDEKLCIVFEQLSFLVPVFISCSCHNTLKQTWWLEKTELYYLIVLEGRGVNSRCQHSPPTPPPHSPSRGSRGDNVPSFFLFSGGSWHFWVCDGLVPISTSLAIFLFLSVSLTKTLVTRFRLS